MRTWASATPIMYNVSHETHIGPPVEVGTLLNPMTPLVGFTSISALLPQDRLTRSATTSGPSFTRGVAPIAAVVKGRMSGGVVVIASGPNWTTAGVIDGNGAGAGVGSMEFVINLGADVGIDEKGRAVGLERVVPVDEALGWFEAGAVFGFANCPRSLIS